MNPSKPIRTLGSKWIKTKVLLQNNELRSFIPETRLFNRSNLLIMLKKYKMVYVKPIHGSFGIGVIRVESKNSKGGNEYRYHLETKVEKFNNYDACFSSLNKNKLNRKYIVQQGIDLLTYKERPFDIRIMVQRSEQRPWETTGLIGRLAHPKKIVTNYHSQGKPLPLDSLLKSYIKESEKQEYTYFLKKFGVNVAKHLQTKYPGFREIGVDVGIDSNLHPWILEVNTAPDPFIFNQLKDKTIFRKVLKFARANGRFTRK